MVKKKKDNVFSDLTQDIDLDKFRISVQGAFSDFQDPRITTRCVYPAWSMFLVILFRGSNGMYRRHWEIETMFGCLKTHGFRLEDTHITDPDKIEKVVFVLAIAFCWAYRIGISRIRYGQYRSKLMGERRGVFLGRG